MKVEKKLKRLGIRETKEFTKEEKNLVAQNVTDSLVMSFPILKNEQSNIFNKIKNANMFYTHTDDNLPKINYMYENRKIYFDETVNIKNITDAMIHEIIHYMQDIRKKNNQLSRIGLCSFNELSLHGLGINEGAVQYISAKVIHSKTQVVNRAGIILKTFSPTYYPILTNLTEQIVSLIGEDELVKAIILNDEELSNTFFNTFEGNAQSIINLFDELIEYNDMTNKKNIQKTSQQTLKSTYIEVQDLIMKTYFEKQYKLIENEEDIQKLSKKLENYIELTGKVEINGYYYNNSNNYKATFIHKLDQKLIKIHEQRSKMALTVVYSGKLNKLLRKIKELFKLNV